MDVYFVVRQYEDNEDSYYLVRATGPVEAIEKVIRWDCKRAEEYGVELSDDDIAKAIQRGKPYYWAEKTEDVIIAKDIVALAE